MGNEVLDIVEVKPEVESSIDLNSIRSNKRQVSLTGWRLKWAHYKHLFYNVATTIRVYKSPVKIYRLLRKFRKLRMELVGKNHLGKLIKLNGKYFWRLGVPGWESELFTKFLLTELNRIEPHKKEVNRIITSYIAITKKCPLRCEHCFEWKNLNQPEVLSTADIEKIINNLQKVGVSNIGLTGGEPMLRVKEMLPLIQKYRDKSAFWMLTSGFNFTEENAKALAKAGLTGVHVSLDHYLPEEHDKFRGKEGAFEDAIKAVKYSLDNDLVTVLSVCFTKDTANKDFVQSFMELAKDLGVGFVQFLEPRAVGHYEGKNVALSSDQIALLETTYNEMSFDPSLIDYPIIIYHGYYQRRIGCFSAGTRGAYIDTNGDLLSCPFCHNKFGNAITDDLNTSLDAMSAGGCPSFTNKVIF
jgi:MoaA/NifB/PqqE/SkfB family radical SAM enzyme